MTLITDCFSLLCYVCHYCNIDVNAGSAAAVREIILSFSVLILLFTYLHFLILQKVK